MTELPTARVERDVWRPVPYRVRALSLLCAPTSDGCVPLLATRWLARFAGVGWVEVSGRHPVRDRWLPAAAGGVAIALVAVAAMAAAGAIAAVGGGNLAVAVAGLAWGGLLMMAYRAVLRDAPRRRARWGRIVTVLWAACIGLLGSAPLEFIEWFSPDVTSSAGRALAATGVVAGSPILVALAVLPVPTLWRRVPAPGSPGVASVYLTRMPSRRRVQVGLAARASLWLGGQRDDIAGRWPLSDRLHHARAGMVAACSLLGTGAAGTALDVAGAPLTDAVSGGLLWGWACAAVARHHLVVVDDTPGRAGPLRLASGVASLLMGIYTGLFLSIGVLARMAPARTDGPLAAPGRLLPLTAGAGGVAQAATLILLAFALFLQLLPVLPWPAGGVLTTQRRLVALLDIATLVADRDQENECRRPGAEASGRPEGVNRE